MTDLVVAGPRLPALKRRLAESQAVPVATMVLFILLVWYLAAIGMNADLQRDAFSNAGVGEYSVRDFISGTWSQTHPRLPVPHQIMVELWKSCVETPPGSKRSLIYHAGITLEATLLGFAIGSAFGFGLSLLIVHMRSLDCGLMPWIIASQAVPVVALAPMIVVILNQASVTGMLPKAVIAAYLSFFPVTVGMVKGLRAADPLWLDLMRTYSAGQWSTLIRLRLPASRSFLFASLRVGVAASLVGTIVAEVSKSEDGGLGARLLAGSYYGQTVQIWAALMVAAICGAMLVWLVGWLDRLSGINRQGGP